MQIERSSTTAFFSSLPAMVAKDQESNFQQLCKVPTDYGITFTKYKSSKTGLTVAIADIEGKWIRTTTTGSAKHWHGNTTCFCALAPLVNGYFALATESKSSWIRWYSVSVIQRVLAYALQLRFRWLWLSPHTRAVSPSDITSRECYLHCTSTS